MNSTDSSEFDTKIPDVATIDRSEIAYVGDGILMKPTYDHEADRATAHIFGTAGTDTGEVSLHVEPEVDETHAVVPSNDTDGDISAQSTDCAWCHTYCNHSVYGDIVLGVDPDASCSDRTYTCSREPTCNECPGQSKCDSGW